MNKRGFTLIELLIVIAILGILAAVILVAINPLEQFARGRDAGRKSTVAQLGHAAQAFFTARGVYPSNPVNSTWGAQLTTAGEIVRVPSGSGYTLPGGGTACTTNPAAGPGGTDQFCYNVTAPFTADAIVFARMESGSENSKCVAPNTAAWYVWSAMDGRGGLVCTAGQGSPPTVGVQNFNVQQ